jgi:hypothetical protein
VAEVILVRPRQMRLGWCRKGEQERDVGGQVSADSVSMASEASAVPAGAGDGGGRRVLTIGKHRCSGLSPRGLHHAPVCSWQQACLLPPLSAAVQTSVRPCITRTTQGLCCAGKLKRFHEILSLHAGAAAVEDLDAAHAAGMPPTVKHHVPGEERWRTCVNGRVLDDTRKVAELLVHDILARPRP